MAAAGAHVPVLPGIMPITSYARLMRIHELSGQRIPADLAEELRRCRTTRRPAGPSAWRTRSRMSEELLAEGAPCLHFYTFNRSKATIEVLTRAGHGAGAASLTDGPDDLDTPEGAFGIASLVLLLALVAVRLSRRLGHAVAVAVPGHRDGAGHRQLRHHRPRTTRC